MRQKYPSLKAELLAPPSEWPHGTRFGCPKIRQDAGAESRLPPVGYRSRRSGRSSEVEVKAGFRASGRRLRVQRCSGVRRFPLESHSVGRTRTLDRDPGEVPYPVASPSCSSHRFTVERIIMEIASSYSPEAPPLRHSVMIGAERWRVTSKLAELWQYRELFYFFVWRDVKVRYAQSILGIGWAIIQPLLPMIIFTVVFGRVARISSDGIPYALFSYAALVPWTYFSNALNDSSGSLVKEVNMLSKIYFPRLIIPLTSVLGRLIDLVISFLLLFVLMAWYRTTPTVWVVLLPRAHPDCRRHSLRARHVAERDGGPVP